MESKYELVSRRLSLVVASSTFRSSDGTSGVEALQAPSAVVFGNDYMALAFMRRVQGRGRRIPDDVSVVGFDDAPSAQLAFPGLTTSRQETRHMGALACRKLLSPDRVEREPAVAFPMRLVVRQSTGVARN